MSVATALLCPDVLPIVSSRISVAGRSRSTPVDACGIEGACGGTFHLRGWWALPIAAHEPDPRSIRQNYVISFTTGENGGRGGGPGGSGSGGNAAAKTKRLGVYDTRPTAALEAESREATMKIEIKIMEGSEDRVGTRLRLKIYGRERERESRWFIR